MLETILDRHVVFVLLGILVFAGVVSKCVVNISLKRLVRAAGNMNKSTHPLMRLVRAKFEHASMISDKVENVRVFVDKYLYEYRVLGIRLHGWRRMEKASAVLCLLVGAAGAGLAYYVNGLDNLVWRIGITGAGLAVFVCLVHLMTDERYQLEAVRNYMVDYLENVCLHKYEKSNPKEIKVLTQEGFTPEFGVMPPDAGYDKEVRNPNRGLDAKEREPGRGLDAREREAGHGLDVGERNADGAGYAARSREAVREPSAVNIFHAAELADEALGAARDDVPIRDEAVEAFRNSDSIRTDEAEAYEAEAYQSVPPVRGEAAQAFWKTNPVREEEAEAVRRSEPVQDEAVEVFRKAESIRKEAETIRNEAAGANRAAELIRNEAMGVGRTAESRRGSAEVEIEKPKPRESSKENIVEIPAPEYAKEAAEPVVIEPPGQSKASIRSVSQRQMSSKERGTYREKAESEPDRDIVIRRILEEFMA